MQNQQLQARSSSAAAANILSKSAANITGTSTGATAIFLPCCRSSSAAQVQLCLHTAQPPLAKIGHVAATRGRHSPSDTKGRALEASPIPGNVTVLDRLRGSERRKDVGKSDFSMVRGFDLANRWSGGRSDPSGPFRTRRENDVSAESTSLIRNGRRRKGVATVAKLTPK